MTLVFIGGSMWNGSVSEAFNLARMLSQDAPRRPAQSQSRAAAAAHCNAPGESARKLAGALSTFWF